MGNVSVKQHKLHENKTRHNKRKTNNNTRNKKRRVGGQGSPLNPNNESSSPSSSPSRGTKKRKVEKDNQTLYSILQKHKGRSAYLKEKRRQQFAAQKHEYMSGSPRTMSVKRKSI